MPVIYMRISLVEIVNFVELSRFFLLMILIQLCLNGMLEFFSLPAQRSAKSTGSNRG